MYLGSLGQSGATAIYEPTGAIAAIANATLGGNAYTKGLMTQLSTGIDPKFPTKDPVAVRSDAQFALELLAVKGTGAEQQVGIAVTNAIAPNKVAAVPVTSTGVSQSGGASQSAIIDYKGILNQADSTVSDVTGIDLGNGPLGISWLIWGLGAGAAFLLLKGKR